MYHSNLSPIHRLVDDGPLHKMNHKAYPLIKLFFISGINKIYTTKTVFFIRLHVLNEGDKNKLTVLNIYKILSLIHSLHLSFQLLVHPLAALVPSSADT